MRISDWSSDVCSSDLACIVIGIAVDDTIQFLARFNADARAGADEAPAVASALSAVLRPVTLSTIALCSGFLVFAGSTLATQVQFGLLSAFRSEEHTSDLQSLLRTSYAVFCLKKKNNNSNRNATTI